MQIGTARAFTDEGVETGCERIFSQRLPRGRWDRLVLHRFLNPLPFARRLPFGSAFNAGQTLRYECVILFRMILRGGQGRAVTG